MLTGTSQKELLRLLRNGDKEAFSEIYERNAVDMLAYADRILSDTGAVEDLVQNIFIDLWSRRSTVQIDNLRNYLFRAVKFQIFKYFRDKKFTPTDLSRLNILEASIDVSQKMEFHELEKAITYYIDQLPPRCKEIFELSRFEHLSHKEIAEKLGISIQAVKNQIGKALSHLKQCMNRDGLSVLFLLLFNFF